MDNLYVHFNQWVVLTSYQTLHLVIRALLPCLSLLLLLLWVQVMKPLIGTQKQIGEVRGAEMPWQQSKDRDQQKGRGEEKTQRYIQYSYTNLGF